jgi:D-alanyl-D-alanine carboxypeptidase/D-alanyl-D-alanine-endopeptidase (penicillin-binding protein 4)
MTAHPRQRLVRSFVALTGLCLAVPLAPAVSMPYGRQSGLSMGAAAAARAATTGNAAAGPSLKPPKRKASNSAPTPSWSKSDGPAELASQLSSTLAGHTRSGQWGVVVLSLTKGDTLFEQNADGQMAPASTMKMFTSSMALDHFGPDYVFKTPVLRDGSVSNGVLTGNIYLRGVGDPSLSGRFWKGDTPMDALARQVAQSGIKSVTGDVVGDATAFDSRTIPDGWKKSYLGASYAARVSALSLNENLVWVVVQPGGTGAAVSLDPATTTIPVQNQVRLTGGSGGSIRAARQADGSIVVKGSIGRSSAPRRYSLVVDDPALFTTGALRAALEKAGVKIAGTTRLGKAPSNATTVAVVASPPLGQIVGEMNRESINIVAELLFRSAAVTPSQVGSAETGLSTLRTFLSDKVHARSDLISVSDGSGLSELDRVTPRAMVELLSYAHESPWSSVFHASLPVEGESGTLRRHKGTPARGNLHAKTGTTNTVASLGGFVTARNGEVLAFSFIYNGSDRWNAKSAMDMMGASLAEFSRER